MKPSTPKPKGELHLKLKWLTFARLVFTTLLLGSTIIFQLSNAASPLARPLLGLYGLIITIFILSFFYALALNQIKHIGLFAYIQTGIDTVIVTVIIFVTGSFFSIFSFLYLVVIIYSSMLLHRDGSLIVAGICSLQYALMCGLEYQGVIAPFSVAQSPLTIEYNLTQVLYKVTLTATGCFAVAVLSSLLAEQARKSKRQLWAMEDQVKRVENMAAIGEMAAGLAHEIKNPLASLIGSIQILKDGILLDADHERLMHIVLREADRLNSLATNFLLFAKPPAGKVESIDLEKALTDIIELFEKNDSNRGEVSVKKEVASGFWIEMDPTHLRQVMWNLLLNAAEAIEGDGEVAIKLSPGIGKDAQIEIADDGCGMSSDTIQSIFDPFFTTKPSGTGLGLSIVHSILESYDSKLEVRSKIGLGTTFTLQLKCIIPPPKS